MPALVTYVYKRMISHLRKSSVFIAVFLSLASCVLLNLWFIAACAHSDLQKLLFVFGDSYVDTGNLPKTGPYSGPGSLYPYGITWPHYPTGRCGDGKILTDFLGK